MRTIALSAVSVSLLLVCSPATESEEQHPPRTNRVEKSEVITVDRTIVLNADGTLTDSKTGLMWIRQFKKHAKTVAEARTVCSDLKFANRSDWRLPTREELVDFINFVKTQTNSVDFVTLKETVEETGRAVYWTSSEHIQNPQAQGGFIIQSTSPLIETVTPTGSVVIHGGAEDLSAFVIPVRKSRN